MANLFDGISGMEGFEPLAGFYADDHKYREGENSGISPDYDAAERSPVKPHYWAEDGIFRRDYTDTGNAIAFSEWAKGSLLFCKGVGWLCWTGKVWKESNALAENTCTEFLNAMLDDAMKELRAKMDESPEATKASEAKIYLQHAQKSRSKNRREALMELAKPLLDIQKEKLDADPYAINTEQYGLVHLNADKREYPSYTHYCTKICDFPTAYNDEERAAGEKLWKDFLELITCGDEELEHYLQQVIGMGFIGKPRSMLFIVLGGGFNGKSTFFNAIKKVMGEYAGDISSTILTADGYKNKLAAKATLLGKRLTVCGELSQGQRLDTGTMKDLCSDDAFRVEKKYEQEETIPKTHTLFLFSNYLPQVSDTVKGTWRRLQVIPFNATMPTGDAEIPDYADYLYKKAGFAIFEWAVEGAREFCRNGEHLHPPKAVEDCSKAYQMKENWIQRFISECCTTEKDENGMFPQVNTAVLYKRYVQWSQETGEKYTQRRIDFYGALQDMGIERVDTAHRMQNFVGIGLDNT